MTKPADSTTAQSKTAQTQARSPFELPFTMPVMPEAFGQLMRDQIARTQQVMGELAGCCQMYVSLLPPVIVVVGARLNEPGTMATPVPFGITTDAVTAGPTMLV